MLQNLPSGIADYYRRTDPMIGHCGTPFEDLPDTHAGLATALHGLMIHQHIAPAYGETLSPRRIEDAHLRAVPDMLARLVSIDPRPLAEARPPADRLVGVCRHYALLLTAALRHKGVPARARCGFATYFEPGRGVDHWVCEAWDAHRGRWVLIDAQLDARQREIFRIGFDPLDVPRDAFRVAAEAWRDCRAGRADPDSFGILDMTGYWFIAGNVVRDLAALNNMAMLPWDVWGGMPEPRAPMAEDALARFDALAACLCEPDANIEALRDLYEREWKVPPTVLNYVRGCPERI